MQLRGEIRADRPLVVVALEEEAAYLGDRLPVLLTGVGKVNAAVAVSTALARTHPAAVINVGTAGSVRSGWDGTHEVSRAIQHDLDDELLRALTGRSFAAPIDLGVDGPTLATGDVFVSSSAVRARIGSVADLVDMEGYAVAVAARQSGVPVRLVKHVSDTADDGAAHSWKDAVDDAAHRLADWLADHV